MGSGRISIALCTYNGEKYLWEQLRSIAQQTRPPHELVIYDDASTDSTPDIVMEFAHSVRFPIRFFRNTRTLGSTKNNELAIAQCEGDFIALCDQDDIWLPEKLAWQADLMERYPNLGGVFSDALLIDDASRPIGKRLWASFSFTRHDQKHFRAGRSAAVLFRKYVVTGPTLMLRADLRPLILPIPGTWFEDAWIAWMLALYSELAPIQTPLIHYRIHADQQVGVARLGQLARMPLRERFDKARREEPAKHLKLARELEELKRRLAESKYPKSQVILDIQKKSFFLAERASPSRNRFAHTLRILFNAANYRRYEAGWQSFLRDIAMQFL